MSELSSEVKAALLSQMFAEVDQTTATLGELAERLDTIAKRVDYEEGRILEAAKTLDKASDRLAESASATVEKNRTALSAALNEYLREFLAHRQTELQSDLADFKASLLAEVEKREAATLRDLSPVPARVRKIESKISTLTIFAGVLSVINLLILFAVVWRILH